MSSVEYIKGNSFFHRLDPRVKIILMLLFILLVFSTKNFIIISIVFLFVVITWFASGLPIKKLMGTFKLLLILYLFILIMQALFQDGKTILLQPIIPDVIPLIGGAGKVTLEGVTYGLILCYRLTTLIILMPMITMTTDISTLSLGLVKLGLPYKIAYMATTAINMIPSLQEQVKTIMDAQKLRGFTVFEEGKIVEKMTAYPTLVVPMVLGAMKKSMLIGIAMDARAFACKKDRTYVDTIKFHISDMVYLSSVIILISALFVWNLFF